MAYQLLDGDAVGGRVLVNTSSELPHLALQLGRMPYVPLLLGQHVGRQLTMRSCLD